MEEVYTPERPHPHSLPHTLKSGLNFGLLAFLFLTLLAAFTIFRQMPPSAVASAAPASEYSSGRALKHLTVIGQKPHPIGSQDHADVRGYIINELGALGLQPEVQETSVVSSRRGVLRAATVRNIAARLEGTGEGKSLLLVGHYDTVPNAAGASDNGSSVATLLETLRALKAGAPPGNDIIFLFTDGEEVGLLGAKAFAEEHHWAKDVGLVLNFEARGTGGPVLMFETSEGNNWLIGEFARASPRPMANSLSYEIYKLLPNDTDLTVFKGAGLPGLNFAYIDGALLYHTQADSVENLDEGSLQHKGSAALALARHFGNVQLERPREGNAVYFDVLGLTLLHYPAGWVVPLTLLCVVLFAAVVVLGFVQRRLRFKGMLAGIALFVLTVAVSAGVVTLVWWIVSTVQIQTGRSLLDDLYRGKLYFAGFAILAVAITVALYSLYRRRVGVENLSVGALFCWLVLLALASLFLPGATYLLVWPLLFCLAGLAFVFATKKEGLGATAAQFAVLALCSVPAVIIVLPLIYQVFLAMGVGQIMAVSVLLVLLSGLLVTHFAHVYARGSRWLPAGAALVAAVLISAAVFNSGFSKQYPKTDHLFYVLNADTGQAVWASADVARDEWTSQFLAADSVRGPLKDYMPMNPYNFLRSPAGAAPLPPGDIKVVSDATQGDVRKLNMRVTSQHNGVNIAVPAGANIEVVAASVGGRRVESERRGAAAASMSAWELVYWSPPEDGFELELELKGSGPVPLKVLERTYGLPILTGKAFKPRPDYIIPSGLPDSDQSLVTKSYSF